MFHCWFCLLLIQELQEVTRGEREERREREKREERKKGKGHKLLRCLLCEGREKWIAKRKTRKVTPLIRGAVSFGMNHPTTFPSIHIPYIHLAIFCERLIFFASLSLSLSLFSSDSLFMWRSFIIIVSVHLESVVTLERGENDCERTRAHLADLLAEGWAKKSKRERGEKKYCRDTLFVMS